MAVVPVPASLPPSMSASPRQGPPLLSARRLSVTYGRVRALDGVDLDVRAGEVVALAGENGAGKSTLVRCLAGDIVPAGGEVLVDGLRLTPRPQSVARSGIAVVWQDLALCDNLDVASNLLLGHEPRRLFPSGSRFYARAAAILAELGIPIDDPTRSVKSLSGGQRQMLAVARSMRDPPRLLILDEPTAALGVNESAQVEELAGRLRAQGTAILLVSHDVDQMFRFADRVTVLRQGRVLADLDTAASHPDDVVALLSGQEVDSSPRRQLTRLGGLVDSLSSADPSSSLPLILSALGAALGATQLCIHLVEGPRLRMAACLGLPDSLVEAWSELVEEPGAGGPVALAAVEERPTVEADVVTSPAWSPLRTVAARAGVAGSWSVPVMGAGGLTGVITVLRPEPGPPQRDELDLVTLYAGYAASAIERDRLLGVVTGRNQVLETIREILETLAGPVPIDKGLAVALSALHEGLHADHVGLFGQDETGGTVCRAWAGRREASPEPPAGLRAAATWMLHPARSDGKVRVLGGGSDVDELLNSGGARRSGAAHPRPTDSDGDPHDDGGRGVQPPSCSYLAVSSSTSRRPTALVAGWEARDAEADDAGLLEDAARSFGLALEREESEEAHRAAAALRHSRELQQDFLSRLSHELRTPLTAIRGYASSLMQPDVTWDGESEERFLDRIAAESARLGRLVDDLLDFSSIESRILRLHPDWCNLGLVLDAAVACLAPPGAASVDLVCADHLPVVWADHDRLEQVLVNLMDNALRHNRAGTRVRVEARLVPASPTAGAGPAGQTSPARPPAPDQVEVTVTDDGAGVPAEVAADPFGPERERRSPTAGAGLGLSIAKGIVDAHGGTIALERLSPGTRFRIRLPVERPPDSDRSGTTPRG